VPVDYALLEWDDGVVGDGNVFRTDLGAALGDVAVADAVTLLELVRTIQHVEGVHLELSDVNQEARSDELLVEMVVPQHVTHVLA
jgi:hypothetical protein